MAKPRQTAESVASSDHWWWWVGASFPVGAGVGALASQLTLHPFVVGLLWLLPLGMLLVGLRKFGKLALLAGFVVGGFLTYNLWHATSPHADVRFIGTPQFAIDPVTGLITVRVTYENRGPWGTRIRPVYAIVADHGAIEFLQDTANRNADEKLEESQKVDHHGPETPEMNFEGFHKSKYPADSYLKPDGPTIVIAARIGYSDWWPIEKVAKLCVFMPPGTNRIAFCSQGNDGLSRRVGQ